MVVDHEGISVLKARHDFLVERLGRLEDNLKGIYKKLERIGNRPSWLTVSIITFLSSGFFSMLAILVAVKT